MRTLRLSGLAALAAAALAVGCGQPFEPYAPGPPFFVIDGVLDGRQDSVFLRVQDLTVPPGATPEQLDATVTITDLSTGEVVQLDDRLVTLDDGELGHLFTQRLRVRSGRTYRVRAERTGETGGVSEATVALPEANVSVNESITPLGNGLNNVQWRITPAGAIRAPTPPLQLVYTVRRTDTAQEATVARAYPLSDGNGDGIWTAQANLGVDAESVREALGLAPLDTSRVVEVVDFRVRYVAALAGEVPIQAGLGGLAWVLPQEVSVTLNARTLDALFFLDAQD